MESGSSSIPRICDYHQLCWTTAMTPPQRGGSTSITKKQRRQTTCILTLSRPDWNRFMSLCGPEIHLCFLQNFVLSKNTAKFVFPSRFWCQSNYHPKKIKMTQKNFSYTPIFRAHFWDEKTRAELRTYMYVVGQTEVSHKWRIYTSLGLKELISLKKIYFSHLSAMTQLGAPGLRKAGAVFIDLWYHMKPREPLPCVGNPLL